MLADHSEFWKGFLFLLFILSREEKEEERREKGRRESSDWQGLSVLRPPSCHGRWIGLPAPARCVYTCLCVWERECVCVGGGGGGGGADLGIFRLTKVTCPEAMVTGLAFQPQQGVCVLMLVCVCVWGSVWGSVWVLGWGVGTWESSDWQRVPVRRPASCHGYWLSLPAPTRCVCVCIYTCMCVHAGEVLCVYGGVCTWESSSKSKFRPFLRVWNLQNPSTVVYHTS